jgi:AcrR family transcriptional regulator
MTATARKPAPNGEDASHDDGGRRAQIVRASARLFRDKGFEATTVRDIAAAVGMQSGSPFYHFGSKHDILLAVMEQGLIDGLRRTEQAAAQAGSAVQCLRALVRTQYGILHEPGSEFIAVMLYDWRSLPPAQQRELVALKDRYDAVWQRTLEQLQLEGRLGVDPKLARLLLLGAINYSATWFRPDAADGTDLDALADATVRLVLGDDGSDESTPHHGAAQLRALGAELQAIRAALGAESPVA